MKIEKMLILNKYDIFWGPNNSLFCNQKNIQLENVIEIKHKILEMAITPDVLYPLQILNHNLKKTEVAIIKRSLSNYFNVIEIYNINDANKEIPILALDYNENYYNLSVEHNYLWFGDCNDGVFIQGPISGKKIREENLSYIRLWSYNDVIKQHGFDDSVRPSRAMSLFCKNPLKVSKILYNKIKNNHKSELCLLLKNGEYKLHGWGNRAMLTGKSLDKLFSLFFWDRGLVRNISSQKLYNGNIVVYGKIPCINDNQLESVAGTGKDFVEASSKCFYEGLERYSASLTKEISVNKSILPKVAFPYVSDKKDRSTTVGLAFHRDERKAKLNAVLEIIEKAKFYKKFQEMSQPYIIKNSPIKSTNIVFFYYPNSLNIFSINCFFFMKNGCVRGSASDTRLDMAIRKSYQEALMSKQNYDNGHILSEIHKKWGCEETSNTIRTYLNTGVYIDYSNLSNDNILSDEELLQSIETYYGNRLKFIPLPKPAKDCYVFRALISDYVTDPCSEKINKVLKLGIPL